MMTHRAAILRTRRDLLLAIGVKIVLAAAAVYAVLTASASQRLIALFGVAVAWMSLSIVSRRGSALAMYSAALIAAGEFDAAEVHLDRAIRTFSFFRAGKLMTLHHLAVLRQAQRRWGDVAALSRAVIGFRLGAMRQLANPARLMLAEASLETGDASAAGRAVDELAAQKLSLAEQLRLLQVRLDLDTATGAWASAAADLPTKARLAELMPTISAARTQALLALAARKVGRADWEQWLCTRVALLIDVRELVARRPILRELWA